jgi:hypothetical protein
MLRFHEGRMQDDPRLDAKKAWRPVTAGLRSWRAQMSRQDAISFEAAAGDLLDRLGYARVSPSAAKEQLDRAARVREIFAGEIRARSRPVPRGWSNGSR